MKTIKVKLFEFSELSEEAKERAVNDYNNEGHEYSFWHEAKATLDKFEEIIPGLNIKGYSINLYGPTFVNYELNPEYEQILEFSGIRLMTYLWNNLKHDIYKGKYYTVNVNRVVKHNRVKCQTFKNGNVHAAYYSAITIQGRNCNLTGVCFDEDILTPIYDILEKYNPTIDFEDLISNCIDSWIKTVVSDMEYQQSEEHLKELSEANEYMYLENGKFYN